jgi:AraC-like DNA-binding protein
MPQNLQGSTQVIRHESPLGSWEYAIGTPHASLGPHVRSPYYGWIEDVAVPICRREVPTEDVPIIINFGAPFRLYEQGDRSRWTDYRSFTTGAYDSYVLVGSTGASAGLQVNLSILGLRLFLGRPLGEMANRAVELEDVLGPEAGRLTARLFEAPSWEARFAILDCALAARMANVTAPSPAVLCAWSRLVASGGRVAIGAIVDEVGFSQRHLIAQFREEFGLSPKTLARVLRFGHAVSLIKAEGGGRLADIALDCGYYDQAHFSRDFRAFAGVTPTELIASRLPDSGGFDADR